MSGVRWEARGGGRRRTTANDGGRRPAGCKRENKNPTVMWGKKQLHLKNTWFNMPTHLTCAIFQVLQASNSATWPHVGRAPSLPLRARPGHPPAVELPRPCSSTWVPRHGVAGRRRDPQGQHPPPPHPPREPHAEKKGATVRVVSQMKLWNTIEKHENDCKQFVNLWF